jgi:hypothetical protein
MTAQLDKDMRADLGFLQLLPGAVQLSCLTAQLAGLLVQLAPQLCCWPLQRVLLPAQALSSCHGRLLTPSSTLQNQAPLHLSATEVLLGTYHAMTGQPA